jgi:hypothetical protein
MLPSLCDPWNAVLRFKKELKKKKIPEEDYVVLRESLGALWPLGGECP